MTNAFEIIDYAPQYKLHFEIIGREWIEDSYTMEEEDIQSLSNPETYILKKGGAILFIKYNGKIAGTVALEKKGKNEFEMVKMGVSKVYRGLGIGKALTQAAIEKAKELGAKKIILHSNKAGSAKAIRLYSKSGFQEVPLGNAPWKRADIKMELYL